MLGTQLKQNFHDKNINYRHYRQLELLEGSHRVLLSAVRRLYRMIRASEAWSLPEPNLNSDGEPAIHSIAELLGCTRTNVVVVELTDFTAPEDEASRASQSNGDGLGGEIDSDSVVQTTEAPLDAMAHLDDGSESTSASVPASPHDSRLEAMYEVLPTTQDHSYDYNIGVKTPESSHQLYFNYNQTSGGPFSEAFSTLETKLQPSGNNTGATIVRADSAQYNVDTTYPMLRPSDIWTTNMSDFYGYWIPAWNNVRNIDEALWP